MLEYLSYSVGLIYFMIYLFVLFSSDDQVSSLEYEGVLEQDEVHGRMGRNT